jgi:hypothetical protein
LAGLLRFIPYAGPILAFALAFLFSVASSPAGSWAQPLEVVVLFGIIEALAFGLIEPLIYGRTTEVSAPGLLIAAMFWTWLWGLLGLLLSTPMTVFLAVLGKYVPSLRFLATLLGEDPPLSADVKFYQRLLAMDQDGANEIVENALKTCSCTELFDSILIPTLAHAKRDAMRDELEASDQLFIERVVGDIVEDLEGVLESELKDSGETTSGPPMAGTRLAAVAVDNCVDALVLRMLGQALAPAGCELEIITDTASPLKLAEILAHSAGDFVILSHLPPGGLTLTRYLIKRLRARLTNETFIVGYWNEDAAGSAAGERLKVAGASEVVTSIAAARDLIRDHLQRKASGLPPPAAPEPAMAVTAAYPLNVTEVS